MLIIYYRNIQAMNVHAWVQFFNLRLPVKFDYCKRETYR